MTVIPALQSRLAAAARPATKQWWDGYLKGAIEFRGVPMAGIRRAVHDWFAAEGIEVGSARAVAYDLIRQRLAEDKLAGIVMLREILLPRGLVDCDGDLDEIGRLFDDGAIDDWNTCDWLCVRVLGPLAEQHGERCARRIAAWSDAAQLWRARAAGVAFVDLAPRGEDNFAGFTSMLLRVCGHNVARPERFAQTGAGWVLRELSIAEPASVADFVQAHVQQMSREAVRSAVRRLPEQVATDLLELHGRR